MRKMGMLLLVAAIACSAQQSAQVLADILQQKGLIGSVERARIQAAGNEEGVLVLAAILKERGFLDAGDLARVVPVTRLTPAAYTTAVAAPVSQQPAAAAPVTNTGPFPVLSKVPIQVYGTVLVNSFYNTSLNNNQDTPSFAGKQGSDPAGGDKNFGMVGRSSRFGFNYTGAQVAGGKLSGTAEFDFSAGSSTVANGSFYFVPRLRLAYAKVEWKNASVEAGQDWSIFAPLNPTSFASYSTAAFNGSGNVWAREPQIRAEFRHPLGNNSKLTFQMAVTDPNEGDNPSTFASPRVAGIGERGRLPAAESRVSYSSGVLTLGLSGHYGRGKNYGLIGTRNVQTGVDSWGVAGDWTLPVGRKIILTGEAFQGRALGAYGASLGQAVLPVGTVGQHGVETRGGWMQAQVNFTRRLQTNLDYGIESPNPHQLTAGLRDKTQTYFGNVIYKWSPNVTLAWEWKRLLTNFRNQQAFNEKGDHVDMAIAFVF